MKTKGVEYNFRQFVLAREYRGFSQSDLAKKILGLSQPNLSKFEKGLGGLSEESLSRIIDYLGFPPTFFEENIANVAENANFRKRSTIGKKVRLRLDTDIRCISFIIDKFSDSLDWPDYSFGNFDVEEGYTPQSIAKHIRKIMGLGSDQPVKNIFNLLEKHGIIIVEYKPESDKFDGVSFVSDTGIPIIIINKNFPNDRKRFTLAHELGHMIMHEFNGHLISGHRDKELEANSFASEFLLPEEAIINSLRGLKISDLGGLKRYWLTSMASIMYRAKDLGCITSDRYKNLNIELSRMGARKKEPFPVEIDTPHLFNEAIKIYINELEYSNKDLEYLFKMYFNDFSKYFTSIGDKPKLRVIR